MSLVQLFNVFNEEEQNKLSEEAASKWDAKIVYESNRRWKAFSPKKRQRLLLEGNAIYADLAMAMQKGEASMETQAVIRRWHAHLQHFWVPDDEQLLGLADLYNEDLRFRQKIEEVAPCLADFMRKAVAVYVWNRKSF